MINKIVIQIDRKNRISTEEIICGLIRGDYGETIFNHPKNDEEININNRYLYFTWLQELNNSNNYIYIYFIHIIYIFYTSSTI